jgi:hypothetical protein
VTEAVALTYEVAPENLRYPTPQTFTALVTGDLVLDGTQTKLVIMGPNPAIGIAFIDLETGELTLGIGQNPMLILGWRLSYSGS